MHVKTCIECALSIVYTFFACIQVVTCIKVVAWRGGFSCLKILKMTKKLAVSPHSTLKCAMLLPVDMSVDIYPVKSIFTSCLTKIKGDLNDDYISARTITDADFDK